MASKLQFNEGKLVFGFKEYGYLCFSPLQRVNDFQTYRSDLVIPNSFSVSGESLYSTEDIDQLFINNVVLSIDEMISDLTKLQEELRNE